MPTLNGINDTLSAFNKKYPATGSRINLKMLATRENLKCSLKFLNVSEPPTERRAKGSVMKLARRKALSINTGKEYTNRA